MAVGDGVITGLGMEEGDIRTMMAITPMTTGIRIRMITATLIRTRATITIPIRKPSITTTMTPMPRSRNNTGALTAPATVAPQQPPAAVETTPSPSEQALQYYSQARAAFLAGDYRGALELAASCRRGRSRKS